MIDRAAIEAKLAQLLDIVDSWPPDAREVAHGLILRRLHEAATDLSAAIEIAHGVTNSDRRN